MERGREGNLGIMRTARQFLREPFQTPDHIARHPRTQDETNGKGKGSGERQR